jgi:D-sedoheptulose 7-phosphate isomerase
MSKSLINNLLKNELKILSINLQKFKSENFTKLCLASKQKIKKGGKIIFFGNGGSASDSQHLATELTVRYKKDRKSIAAISLATDTSALTAIGNDFGFEKIFSRQIEALGKKNDIFVAISTSGNSKNILEALKFCKKKKFTTFALLGNKGGKAKRYVNYPIIFPEASTSVTQAMHITIGHVFCEYLEKTI